MRQDEVKLLLCRGLDRPTILTYAAQNNWEASPEEIDDWISKAQLQLAEDAGNIDTETELGKSLARLNYLYMNATKVQDFKTALSIQKEINKVLALKVQAKGAVPRAKEGERPRLQIAK